MAPLSGRALSFVEHCGQDDCVLYRTILIPGRAASQQSCMLDIEGDRRGSVALWQSLVTAVDA